MAPNSIETFIFFNWRATFFFLFNLKGNNKKWNGFTGSWVTVICGSHKWAFPHWLSLPSSPIHTPAFKWCQSINILTDYSKAMVRFPPLQGFPAPPVGKQITVRTSTCGTAHAWLQGLSWAGVFCLNLGPSPILSCRATIQCHYSKPRTETWPRAHKRDLLDC